MEMLTSKKISEIGGYCNMTVISYIQYDKTYELGGYTYVVYELYDGDIDMSLYNNNIYTPIITITLGKYDFIDLTDKQSILILLFEFIKYCYKDYLALPRKDKGDRYKMTEDENKILTNK